jgi:hypothetical protein
MAIKEVITLEGSERVRPPLMTSRNMAKVDQMSTSGTLRLREDD